MRTLAIGDIHGCYTALKTLLEAVDPQPEDTVITLGDYVDRGPDSKGVMDCLMDLEEKCNLIRLKGNHEDLMQKARVSRYDLMMWLNVGGISTLQSYGAASPDEIPEEYWEFIDTCEYYHETETHIFVHGGMLPELELEEQDEEDLLWLRLDDLKPHQSGKIIVCGHTPQRDHKIKDLGHAICIDTHVFLNGYLTCLDIESGNYWQADEQGEMREIVLDGASS